jgi:predicted transcriptional regulator
MSVHPHYAEAIMDGRKKVEFRKRPLADDVTVVWVYATAPVQRIVGYFVAGPSITAAPKALWRRFRRVGCINQIDFDRYFATSKVGSGIQIKAVARLNPPVQIGALLSSGIPPQSFAYVCQGQAPIAGERTRMALEAVEV